MSQRVLIVDDDPQMLRAVVNALKARDYAVLTAANGETALEVLSRDEVDLILLDLGLPGIEGHEVIRRLRGWSDLPVIVLSVRDAQGEKVAALDAGADDYVIKPFGIGELLARMRAVHRRTGSEAIGKPLLVFGDLQVDLTKKLVVLRGNSLHLTPTEYRLLEAMVTHPGKLLTHSWLLKKVWGPGYGSESNYLRLYVKQLRRKLGDAPSDPTWITTEPGLGYRWLQDGEAGA